ncbi:MAG: hypothetical protein ABI451_11010, partial [Dokdonella sp.]
MSPAKYFTALIAASLLTTTLDARADERLWSNDVDTYTITRDSVVTGGQTPIDQELADDFQVTGEIRRAIIYGYDCWNCFGAFATGVKVRIYAKTVEGKPGNELYGFHLDDGDPRFIHDLNHTGHNGTIDVTFPTPFNADGEYFFSVQLEFADSAIWPIWSSNHLGARGSPIYMRDNLTGGPWVQHSDFFGQSNFDFAFALYGKPPGPPPPNTVAECGEWNSEMLPLPAGATATSIFASKSFGSDESWLVGGYDTGGIGNLQQYSLAYHRIGEGAWMAVPTPSPQVCSAASPCTQVWFNAIDGFSSNDVWAGGWKRGQSVGGFVGGQLFVAHWNGQSWTEIPAPRTDGGTGARVVGIKAIASDDVWFVGDWITPTGWPALAMHWNGSSLQIVPTPFPSGGTPGWSLIASDGVATNDVWAVGHGSDGDPATTPYFLHWNGSAWSLDGNVPAPGDTKEFGALLALASNNVYAGGSTFTVADGYRPAIMHNDGSAWSLSTVAGGGGPMITLGSGSVLALGFPSLFRSDSQWIAQPGLQDYDYYSWSGLQGTGPCNAVGAANVD